MRRWRERYESSGSGGCLTGGEGNRAQDVAGGGGESVGLYQEKYFDPNVLHFHEKLQEEHQTESATAG